jgi:hypothetical protein
MTKLVKLNEESERNHFLKKISNKQLIIYEDVQGSRIYVNWTGEKFIIRPKSVKNDDLNFIDLATQKYYNFAYLYFHSLPDYVTNLLSPNWWFCFEYFPDKQPAHITYNRLPKNNMILTCIVKGSRYFYNIDEVFEYAKLFDVEPLPILFKGKLNPKQIEVISLFLTTSESDLKFVFGETNFAQFFYKILNPLTRASFLMKNGNYNDNLEKIIMKIEGDTHYTFEILNPLYQKIVKDNTSEHLQIYTLILTNFLEFCQLNDIKKYKSYNITKDKLYVDFMSLIFNDYIENMKDDIIQWNFVIPSFFNEDKFKINYNLLNNKKTVKNIKMHPKIEYVFKIILNSFNKKKKKTIGIFTEDSLLAFNNLVEKIDNTLDELLQVNKEYLSQQNNLLNFSDFFDTKYNVDTTGKLYIDDKEMKSKENSSEDKKKEGKKDEKDEKPLPIINKVEKGI